MKSAGDTMRNFLIIHKDGRVFIVRKTPGKYNMPLSKWEFLPDTGRINFFFKKES